MLQVVRYVTGRPFVKRFALYYRTVIVVLSGLSVCLSVTLVYCGQTVGRIKMKLGTQVGLGTGHIVLHGDPAPTTERGTAAPTFEIYGRSPRFMYIVAKRLDRSR